MRDAASLHADPVHKQRFVAEIIETGVGPRLRITDRHPSGSVLPGAQTYLDLPVQARRDDGAAMSWLVLDEREGTAKSFTGDPDDLDDLYSALRRLKVNALFTRRPIVFDPTEDDR